MVYVFLAEGFEEVEALAQVDVLRRAGAQVKTVGVTGREVTSAHKITVLADTTVDRITLGDDLDMIVLPGGMPGTTNLEASSEVQKAIDYCAAKGKFVAAICAAPMILGHKGLLSGRKATCFPGFEKDLKGAEITGLPAVTDGKFITGKGAGAAFDFAFELVTALYGRNKADQLASNMQYR
ncbi:MAG: DJ-1/PfpI family protein [Ruminococcus sp.]|nr:DJ-1/PfpI family protein [Ruminococcus sp.]